MLLACLRKPFQNSDEIKIYILRQEKNNLDKHLCLFGLLPPTEYVLYLCLMCQQDLPNGRNTCSTVKINFLSCCCQLCNSLEDNIFFLNSCHEELTSFFGELCVQCQHTISLKDNDGYRTDWSDDLGRALG